MRRRLLLLVLLLLAFATPAMAHVRVTPAEVDRNEPTFLTFTVPNEEDAANTTKVEIFLPDSIAVEDTRSQPPEVGWTGLYIPKGHRLVYEGKLPPGEELEIIVQILKFPRSGDQIVFKVLQTYDNGEVARWIDIQTGTEEPPHPAPIVKLTGAAPATSQVPATTPPTTAAPDDDDEGGFGGFGLIMLLIATFFAAVGAGIGIGVLRRRAG